MCIVANYRTRENVKMKLKSKRSKQEQTHALICLNKKPLKLPIIYNKQKQLITLACSIKMFIACDILQNNYDIKK